MTRILTVLAGTLIASPALAYVKWFSEFSYADRPLLSLEALSPAFFVLAGLSAVAVSRQTVNAIEKGKFDPSLPLAFRAARLFGMPIEEIFLDETVQFDEGRQP